ncbi:hypothetical protein KSS87_002680 [Heliosperma pusillum]|nr:hypothetical protein KSS87_002680 [Heliosperma pusillum]
MSSSYNSPSRSPTRGSTTAAARLQLGAVSRLRSSSLKKPPEPLRRAVADSLSSSASSSTFSSISALSSHHLASSPSVHASEASRTLRDYLAAPSTTDLAYCVILEHTLAERDRSSTESTTLTPFPHPTAHHSKLYPMAHHSDFLSSLNPSFTPILTHCPQQLEGDWAAELVRLGTVNRLGEAVEVLDVVKSLEVFQGEIVVVGGRGGEIGTYSARVDDGGDPAVVERCIALLKRYLLRYKPSEEILLQIDKFCVHIITECDIGLSRKLLPWSHSLNQQSGTTTTLSNSATPLPVSSFASPTLIKSLKYVRSLVAQHIPRRSFQPAAFAGAPTASKQFLPSLSSLLSRSFNSQLSPAKNLESPGRIDTTLSVPSQRKIESCEGIDDTDYITSDVLKWRWAGDQHSSAALADGGHNLNAQDLMRSNLLEVGAAALLVADIDVKKSQPWKHFGTADMPYLDQLLQPSMTPGNNNSSARHHLRIITASKRTKSGSQQICEQQPLKLNPTEVGEVIAAVCSETLSPNLNLMTISTGLSSHRSKPSIDVAVSVLIKLVIDMYVLDSESAAPLTLSMLEDMVCSPRLSSRTRAFDLILNLAVHAHLLEPVVRDDVSTIKEDYSQELTFDNETCDETQKNKSDTCKQAGLSSAIDKFESWILNILYEILMLLVQLMGSGWEKAFERGRFGFNVGNTFEIGKGIEEEEESVWASALSCLLYFVCDGGKIRRSRLKGLDIRVVKALIEISRSSSWAEIVHSKLVLILARMFYDFSDEDSSTSPVTPKFLADQVDMIGGIDFIFLEYSLARTTDERRNLYSLLFDHVLHQLNVANIVSGVLEHGIGEIQPLATLLYLANAPEAFHISVKLGVQGIGELLRRSVSATLSRYSDSERLNNILEKITTKFDSIISSFTHLQKEFSDSRQLTKTCRLLKSIDDGDLGRSIAKKAKLSWATLHSLLHSDRIPCRQNGYIWLGDLLVLEVSKEGGDNLLSNICSLQQQINLVDLKDPSVLPERPLSVWLMCGLLKSKKNTIRAGFLFVLEVLLMRCKFLLDENELDHSVYRDEDPQGDNCLEKANSVIDIMSCCLSLVTQLNETDHFNILKMCDILFSQLCLKVPPASTDASQLKRGSSGSDVNSNIEIGECVPLQENIQRRGPEDTDNFYTTLVCETSSMAALLLQGRVIVPLQLVSRVPAVLFYWPLIQLAGAATDNIALGVSVGSKGRGNLPGATSDIRAALLLLLIAKCTADPTAFEEVDGEDFFRQLLDDTDSRVAYYSSAFLLKALSMVCRVVVSHVEPFLVTSALLLSMLNVLWGSVGSSILASSGKSILMPVIVHTDIIV